jgi:hypothetical protein
MGALWLLIQRKKSRRRLANLPGAGQRIRGEDLCPTRTVDCPVSKLPSFEFHGETVLSDREIGDNLLFFVCPAAIQAL